MKLPALLLLGLTALTSTHASFINGKEDARKVYVLGETTPPMLTRNAELVPEPIPKRVRYMFAANEVVNTAAGIVRKQVEEADASLFKDTIWLQPGAFKLLKKSCKLEDSKMTMSDPSDIKKGNLDAGLKMSMISKPEQRTAIAKEMARMLKEDGGFVVRAMQSKEMAHWWIYIPFDIEEPVFVIASKGGKYRFVVELDQHNKIVILDELNKLPKQ